MITIRPPWRKPLLHLVILAAISLLPVVTAVQAAPGTQTPQPITTIDTPHGRIEVYDPADLLTNPAYTKHAAASVPSAPQQVGPDADSRMVFDRIGVTWIKNVQTGQVVCGYVTNSGWVNITTAEVNEQSDLFINFAYVASTDSTNINTTSSSTYCYNGGADSAWQGDGSSAATWLNDGMRAWSSYAYLNTKQPARL